jgi:hypothetical protein
MLTLSQPVRGTRGRPPGTRNSVGRNYGTRDLRQMMLQALEMAGGVKYLADRAIDTPGPFLGLLGKILPTTVQNSDGSPIALHLLAAKLVSEEILAAQQSPPTINAEPTVPANLLDAPLPSE